MPNNLGSNFIDFGLGVVAQAAACTLTAFKLEHLHATSNCGSIFIEALLELQQKGGLVEDGDDISHNMQEVDYNS